MADQRVTGALELIHEQITAKQAEIAMQKKLANQLAATAGMDPPYSDIEEPNAPGQSSAIRPDQFANHSAPSTAARAYLEMRGKARGATTIDAIYDALVQGGYNFGASATDSKNSLRIALGKDLQVHRLPNSHYGLTAWYPNMGKPKEKGKKSGDNADSNDESDDNSDGQLLLGGNQEAADKPS